MQGLMFGHAYLDDGTHVALEIKSLSEYEDFFIVKTIFTDHFCGYQVDYDEYIGNERFKKEWTGKN